MLSELSLHNPAIHKVWPVAFLKRRSKLFSGTGECEAERARIMARFFSSLASPYILSKLSSVELRPYRHINKTVKRLAKEDRIFFVVPFCRAFHRAEIISEVRKAEAILAHDMKAMFQNPPIIRIS